MVRNDQTTKWVRPISVDRAAHSKVIVIINNKGGVSKTTIATIVSMYAARCGLNSLAVDFDAQANLTQRLGMGDNLFKNRRLNTFFKHIDSDTFESEYMKFPINVHYSYFYKVPGYEGKIGDLSVLAGDHNVMYAAEAAAKTLAQAKYFTEDGKDIVEMFNIALDGYRKYNDVIVIDTAPAIKGNVLSELAVRVADEIVIPVDGIEASRGLAHLLNWISQITDRREDGKPRPHVSFVMSKYQDDTKANEDVLAFDDEFGIKNAVYRALKTHFPEFTCNAGVKELQSLKNTVSGLSRTNEYDDLCLELLTRFHEETRPDIFDTYQTHVRAFEDDIDLIGRKVLNRTPTFLIPKYRPADQIDEAQDVIGDE